jgi:hypothetical protein
MVISFFTSFFKDKKSQRSHKRFFFIVLLVDGGIRIRTNKLGTDQDPRGPKTYGSYGSGTLIVRS